MRRLYCLALAACIIWVEPASAANLASGKALYAVCAGCHGFQGEGHVAVNAPKLTGLEDWYLARQLQYFKDGIRGEQEADVHGSQMAPFALALIDERALEDVVAYIASLRHRAPVPSVAGDVERGRAAYALCSACHGADGRGNEALSSPSLVGLDDWYLVRQLELYRAGLRGANARDTYGRQMQPMVGALSGIEQMRDLARYITTLNNP